jgi:hypothetical protein
MGLSTSPQEVRRLLMIPKSGLSIHSQVMPATTIGTSQGMKVATRKTP